MKPNVTYKNLPLYCQVCLILMLIFSLVGLNQISAAAAGTTYYVDKTNGACSDAQPGTTPDLPFCTISKGASKAIAGDTVLVLAGTYAETVNVPNSGSAGLPITYSAAPNVTVTGNGTATGSAFLVSNKSYVVISGFSVTGTKNYGIYVSNSNNITISNNHVSYSGNPASSSTRAGIRLYNTNYSTINHNTSDHNSQDGIRLDTCYNITVSNNTSFANAEVWQRNATGIDLHYSYSNTIIYNITYANEDSGINIYANSNNNLIIGNLTYGNGDHGIDANNSPYNTIVSNTVQGNHTSGINIEGTSGNAKVANNVAVDNGIAPITGQKSNIRVDAASVSGTNIDYDIVYLNAGTVQIQWAGIGYSTLAAFKAAVPGQETRGLQANPLFIAPAPPASRPASVVAGNYHLTAGSPAIDSANADAPSEPLNDIEGNPRVDDPATINTGVGAQTYYDRGAYEFRPGGAISTVAPTYTATQLLPTATPTSALIPTATNLSPSATATPASALTATVTNLPPSATATLTGTFTSTPTSAAGSTLTFSPSADSYVREAGPNSNYGTNVQLWVAAGTNANYESYLSFTVIGMSGPIQSAVLRVYATSGTVDGPAVYSTGNNWTETGITWNTRPARTSAGLDDKGAIATNTWIEFNVTPLLSGDGTYSFVLVNTSTDAVSFSSREGSQPPQLVISIK